jgi:ABC-type transport system involved in Fe-S cluster assembly fused permease/ATPase subunit
MERIAAEILTSLATVALAILAVVVFIYYGAGALFYAVVVVALVVGFYNAWMISKAESGIPERPASKSAESQKAAVNLHSLKAARPRAKRKASAKT